jgi:hypothetical protein
MLEFAADRRAVLAVERDVEDGTELGLHLQALAHAHLDAGIVVADRQLGGQQLAGIEERLARMDRVRGKGRWVHDVGLAKQGRPAPRRDRPSGIVSPARAGEADARRPVRGGTVPCQITAGA